MRFIQPTAEPFFFPGNEIGCLLVHGFTGTPKEMRHLGEHLHQQGYTALGVRLFAHATHIDDMKRARWHDWMASVEDGWYYLRDICSKTFVIGLSMGGILSLVFAARFPVHGVIAMATPHHLPADPRVRFIKPLSLLKPYFPKGPSNWYDAQAEKDHISYAQDPTRAYAEVRDLLDVMRRSLPEVRAPALLIYSKDDLVVTAEEKHMEKMLQEIGSTRKESLWIENSSHVITRDTQREKVFDAVAGFIASVAAGDV